MIDGIMELRLLLLLSRHIKLQNSILLFALLERQLNNGSYIIFSANINIDLSRKGNADTVGTSNFTKFLRAKSKVFLNWIKTKSGYRQQYSWDSVS